MLNQRGDHGWIALLTLGNCAEVSQLAHWNPETSALPLAAELADLNQATSIRCLHQASVLANPGDRIRFFQAALLGELVLGTQPGTPYGQLLTNLERYFANRLTEAETPHSREIWEDRKSSAAKR